MAARGLDHRLNSVIKHHPTPTCPSQVVLKSQLNPDVSEWTKVERSKRHKKYKNTWPSANTRLPKRDERSTFNATSKQNTNLNYGKAQRSSALTRSNHVPRLEPSRTAPVPQMPTRPPMGYDPIIPADEKFRDVFASLSDEIKGLWKVILCYVSDERHRIKRKQFFKVITTETGGAAVNKPKTRKLFRLWKRLASINQAPAGTAQAIHLFQPN